MAVKVVYGKDVMCSGWLAEKFGRPVETAPTIGFAKDGKLIGVAHYPNYSGHDIELNYYGPHTMCRSSLRRVFAYPFIQLGCIRVTARCRSEVVDQFIRLGFQHEGVLRRHYGDEDAHILGMLRHECRWLED